MQMSGELISAVGDQSVICGCSLQRAVVSIFGLFRGEKQNYCRFFFAAFERLLMSAVQHATIAVDNCRAQLVSKN